MLGIICLLFSLALASCTAEYLDPRIALPGGDFAKILNYQFENVGTGPYHFAFSTSDGIEREEEGDISNPNTEHEALVVRGSYSYPGPDGITYTVRYTADENGFHPEGEHIKVPPFVPWNKDQQIEDQGFYTQGNAIDKPIVPVYLPGGPQRPLFPNPQPIYGSSNTPKPTIAKYVPPRQQKRNKSPRVSPIPLSIGSTTPKPLPPIHVISTTSRPLPLAPIQLLPTTVRPQSFSPYREEASVITYIPTRRNSGTNENSSSFPGVANSILEILGETEKGDEKKTIKAEDVNSL